MLSSRLRPFNNSLLSIRECDQCIHALVPHNKMYRYVIVLRSNDSFWMISFELFSHTIQQLEIQCNNTIVKFEYTWFHVTWHNKILFTFVYMYTTVLKLWNLLLLLLCIYPSSHTLISYSLSLLTIRDSIRSSYLSHEWH